MRPATIAKQRRWVRFGAIPVVLAAVGCASEPRRDLDAPTVAQPLAISIDEQLPPPAPAPLSRAQSAAATARMLVGTPYRYGGSGPDGFDCSGLVYYSFRKAGVRVPRTSVDLYRATRSVPLSDAQAGDLVFFRLEQKVSHVGIYLGNDEFVHAPSHGGAVRIERLDNEYYSRHLVRAGRLDLN